MATSQRKVEANRANARRSTGPRTARGKRRSKFNALAHGLTSRAGLLPGDDPEQYRRFVRRVLDELDPQGPIQEELAGDIANLSWKLRRVPGAEGILLEQKHSRGAEEPTDVIVNMVTDKDWQGEPISPLWILSRYTRQAERSRATAMRLFLSLRKASEKREDELSRLDGMAEDEAPTEAATEDEAGEAEPREAVPQDDTPEEEPPEEESPREESPEEQATSENALPLRNEANAAADAAASQAEPPQDHAAASPAPAADTGTPTEANLKAITGRATARQLSASDGEGADGGGGWVRDGPDPGVA
jgi:hypothetical protein